MSVLNKGITMVIKGGAGNDANSCHGTYVRQTEIDFQCGPGLGHPVYVKEEADCRYANHACPPMLCSTTWHYPGSLQTQCGVNFFILDSRRVLAPAPKVLGPKHISNPDFACKPF